MSTTIEETSTEIIKVEEITSIMSGAGDVLVKNKQLTDIAVNKITGLLDTIEAEGMNAELDAELNKWQINAKKALEVNYNRRTPITQMIGQITKAFTGLENHLDPQKKDSYYSKAQQYRNSWAAKCANLQKEKEQAILKKQNIEKEAIEIKAQVERQIREAFQNKVLEFKSFYTNKLNTATLETIDTVTKTIKELKTNYPHDKYVLLPATVNAVYHDKAELAGVIYNTRAALYDELIANFKENMEDHQRLLLEQLPSKKAELERISKSNAEQKKVLEEQARQRQLADQKRLQEETEAAKKKDLQNVQMQQSIATSSNLFETTAQLTEVSNAATGKAKTGYKISVLSPAGWGAIFLFWFEKDGQKMDAAAMGKKTLDQMKAFCEKHALKTNEKIDHAHVVYEEDYKAVATK
jgi:hypothetical protein